MTVMQQVALGRAHRIHDSVRVRCIKESDVGILGSILGRREPVVAYRTIDGGHPAPYPDMTDEQLYNYEVTFNVPHRTFDKPPRPAKPAKTQGAETTIRREPPATQTSQRATKGTQSGAQKTQKMNGAHSPPGTEKGFDAPRDTTRTETAQQPSRPIQLPPLDLNKPVRLITTKQPVDIITTRARHPVYKVHAYIGDDDVVTLFTLDGQLTENGPRFLENVPQRQQLYLNVYPNPDSGNAAPSERFLLTQHATRQDADAAARAGRLTCVSLQFDL